MTPEVEAVFASYPAGVRKKLLALRRLILKTAAALPGEAELTESLKWGQPSYHRKGGTAVRIAHDPSRERGFALYVHCQTNLNATFRRRHGAGLEYSGNRALLFDAQQALPEAALADCIQRALTYHVGKERIRA